MIHEKTTRKRQENRSMKIENRTPHQDGFYMPGEFEPQDGVILIWPKRPGSWPYEAKEAGKVFAEIANKLAETEKVYMLTEPETEAAARELLCENVEILTIPTDDAWARDVGPTFVTDGKEVRGVNWSFNAWGGTYDGLYQDWQKDDKVAEEFCKLTGYDYYDAAPFVLEGGSIHSDGQGTVIATEACLLSKGRNPELTKEQIEAKLQEYLGAEKIIWLPNGIYQDETNEHVDNVCAFTKPGEVVLAWTDDESDPQYALSAEDLKVLEQETDAKGSVRGMAFFCRVFGCSMAARVLTSRILLPRLGGHQAVQLRVAGQLIDERHQAGDHLNKPVSGWGVADIVHLRVAGIQQLGQLRTVSRCLIQQYQELAVGEHQPRRIGQQTLLHVLRNTGEGGVVFTEPLPAFVKELTGIVVDGALTAHTRAGDEQIDLVNVDVGVPPLLPVANDTVEDAVQHHQQAHRFQIFAQVLNVKAENTAFCVDIGLVGKYIQTAYREQLQCQRDPVGLRVDLLHQIVIEVFQRRRLTLEILDVLSVDIAHAAVDNGLLLRLDLICAHKLLVERHDKFGLHHQRLFAIAVPLGQVQRIDVTAV